LLFEISLGSSCIDREDTGVESKWAQEERFGEEGGHRRRERYRKAALVPIRTALPMPW